MKRAIISSFPTTKDAALLATLSPFRTMKAWISTTTGTILPLPTSSQAILIADSGDEFVEIADKDTARGFLASKSTIRMSMSLFVVEFRCLKPLPESLQPAAINLNSLLFKLSVPYPPDHWLHPLRKVPTNSLITSLPNAEKLPHPRPELPVYPSKTIQLAAPALVGTELLPRRVPMKRIELSSVEAIVPNARNCCL